MAEKSDMPLASAKSRSKTARPLFCRLVIFVLMITLSDTKASQNELPHPCDRIKCPPMSEIICPEDSEVRESNSPIALLQPHSITASPSEEVYNSTEIANDLYAKCCLTKKCLCKTCYIPSCPSNDDVVIELQAESMETPGQCCGKYECKKKPNCTEVQETETNWLTDCQRCKCYSGEAICHQSCDEGTRKTSAMCNSKTTNTFYEHGESWKEGCKECECVHGEEKCLMPFCRSVNCPPSRQVLLKDSCCPICWPKGIPMQSINPSDYDDEGTGEHASDYEDADEEDINNDINPQPNDADVNLPILPDIKDVLDLNTTNSQNKTNNSKPTTITNATKLTTEDSKTIPNTTINPNVLAVDWINTIMPENSQQIELNTKTSTTLSPCSMQERHNSPATYTVYPKVVEFVQQSSQNWYLYIVIAVLTIVVIVLIYFVINLRAKQRSYRPVSDCDGNSNKMTKLKKINDIL